jgi:glutathione S-transferase
MSITLHHVAQARSFRVLWALCELGVDFTVEQHSFFDGSLQDEAFRAKSPAARVPALDLHGRTYFESGAILELLAETYDGGLGRGVGSEHRGTYLEWLHFGETMGQHLANLTQHHIILFEASMRSRTVMRLEAKRLAKCIGAVAGAVGDQEYLLPDGFSMADIAVGYALWIAQRFVDLAEIDGATAYLDRLSTRPAFQAALTRDGAAQIYTQDFYSPPPKEAPNA